jgi:anti-anti-sigma factor
MGSVLSDDELMIFDIYETDAGGSIAVSSEDDVAVLQLDGEFDVYVAPALRGHCRLVRAAGRACVVDVRHVSFVDSSVLGALLDAQRQSEGLGLPFLLVLPEGRNPVARAMADAKLRFEVRSDLGQAVRDARERTPRSDPVPPP